MSVVSSIAMWFSNNSGIIVITWIGWKIETSISFFILSLITIIFIFVLLIITIVKIYLLPRRIKNNLNKYKFKKAQNAMYDGLIASTYGNLEALNKNFNLSKKISNQHPIFLLLRLQNFIGRKNEVECFKTLTKMLEHRSTQPLAIKGLINIAQKNKDQELFVNMLNKAKEYKVSVKWFIEEALNFCTYNNSWEVLEDFLNNNKEKKNSDLLHILSLINLYISSNFFQKGLVSKSKQYALKAYKINPTFPPIIELYCKLNIAKTNRSLIRKLTRYWLEFPHPNIIDCLEHGTKNKDPKISIKYLNIIFSSSDSYLKYLILGEIKLKAKVFGEAKSDLKKSISIRPTKRAYKNLILLEKSLSNNPYKIKKWESLVADANDSLEWKCKACGFKQQVWNIFCTNCKYFDGLVWQTNQGIIENSDRLLKNPNFNIRI